MDKRMPVNCLARSSSALVFSRSGVRCTSGGKGGGSCSVLHGLHTTRTKRFVLADQEYELLHVIHASDIRAVVPLEVKRIGLVIGIVTHEQTLYIQAPIPSDTYEWAAAIGRVQTQAGTPQSPVRIPRSPTISEPCMSSIPMSISRSLPHANSRFDDLYRGSSPTHVCFSHIDAVPSVESRIDRGNYRNLLGAPHALLSSSEEESEMEADEHHDRVMPLRQDGGQAQQPAPISPVVSPVLPVSPTDPLRPPENDDPDRILAQGYLMKKSHLCKYWHKRWFMLTRNALIYSRSHMDRRVHRRVPTSSILDVMECTSADMQPTSVFPAHNALNILGFGYDTLHGHMPAGGSEQHSFKVVTPSRTFMLCAPTEEEVIKWLSALQTLLNRQRCATINNRIVH